MKTKIAFLSAVLVSLLLVLFAVPAIVFAPKPILYRPMIFVHGGAGSGAQFESQAMRFTSNGYPANYIAVLDYDSTFTFNTMEEVWARLDLLVDTILAETGADKVDTLGHSLGTMVMQGYLAFPWRAAKVAHYVNIDGFPAASLPGGVPTLAIWGMGKTTDWVIVGATNIYFPDQSHVQVCTSAESFVEIYKFFTGEEPEEKHIVPESGQIMLAGRAVIFPLNIWVGTATLEIWKVNGDTGARIGDKPQAIYFISGDGSWGPFKAMAGVNYEFVLLREGMSPHHFYREPLMRSNHLIRLLTSLPGGIADHMNVSDYHSALVILRYKEFWGGLSVNNDILEINGVNVVTGDICPVTKLVNGIWVYDKDADGVSDLTAPIPYYYGQPFQTGVDLYIPADIPPTGTISLVSKSRGMLGNSRAVINVPNWASSNHRITVQFNDYHRC